MAVLNGNKKAVVKAASLDPVFANEVVKAGVRVQLVRLDHILVNVMPNADTTIQFATIC